MQHIKKNWAECQELAYIKKYTRDWKWHLHLLGAWVKFASLKKVRCSIEPFIYSYINDIYCITFCFKHQLHFFINLLFDLHALSCPECKWKYVCIHVHVHVPIHVKTIFFELVEDFSQKTKNYPKYSMYRYVNKQQQFYVCLLQVNKYKNWQQWFHMHKYMQNNKFSTQNTKVFMYTWSWRQQSCAN